MSCFRHSEDYKLRPYTDRKMGHRYRIFKCPSKTPRFLRDSSPAARKGSIWSKRNSRSRFRPNIKPVSFAYQIRQKVAMWQKWYDNFVGSLCGVQPMTDPTGLIYTMRIRYASNVS